jgi:hypothetical protein
MDYSAGILGGNIRFRKQFGRFSPNATGDLVMRSFCPRPFSKP